MHDALALINRAITDYLNPDRGNFDNDTYFVTTGSASTVGVKANLARLISWLAPRYFGDGA